MNLVSVELACIRSCDYNFCAKSICGLSYLSLYVVLAVAAILMYSNFYACFIIFMVQLADSCEYAMERSKSVHHVGTSDESYTALMPVSLSVFQYGRFRGGLVFLYRFMMSFPNKKRRRYFEEDSASEWKKPKSEYGEYDEPESQQQQANGSERPHKDTEPNDRLPFELKEYVRGVAEGIASENGDSK